MRILDGPKGGKYEEMQNNAEHWVQQRNINRAKEQIPNEFHQQ